MTELNGFEYKPEWIQSKLGVKKTLIEIERMIDRLIVLGFLKEENGELYKVHDHIYSQCDKHDEALKKYHHNVMTYAQRALNHQELDDREYNSFCFNIEKKNISKIKNEIRKFKDELISSYEASRGKANDTYQLNIQLFNFNQKID